MITISHKNIHTYNILIIQQESYMQKNVVIKYLPNTTTQEEIKKIRLEFNNKEQTLILMISGKDKLLNCLQSLINVD